MSRRYIWAGEIIDTGDGGVNLDDEEIVGRLNELDHENTKLNAELTESIAAVSDLMDENADLRLQLAEAYERCVDIIRQSLNGDDAIALIRSLIPPKEADHG